MPRTSQRTKAHKRPHLSKMMLLPLPAAEASKASLTYHVALAACRRDGGGPPATWREMTCALYVSHHLWKLGYGTASEGIYRDAEIHMENAIPRVISDGVFHLDSAGASAMEGILRTLDGQLACAQTRHIVEANEKIARIVRGNSVKSPISQ